MHAMHYEITLPADYDMEVIHRRVRTRGRCWTICRASGSRRTGCVSAASTGRS